MDEELADKKCRMAKAIPILCQSVLDTKDKVTVEGLLGITHSVEERVFLVSFCETFPAQTNSGTLRDERDGPQESSLEDKTKTSGVPFETAKKIMIEAIPFLCLKVMKDRPRIVVHMIQGLICLAVEHDQHAHNMTWFSFCIKTPADPEDETEGTGAPFSYMMVSVPTGSKGASSGSDSSDASDTPSDSLQQNPVAPPGKGSQDCASQAERYWSRKVSSKENLRTEHNVGNACTSKNNDPSEATEGLPRGKLSSLDLKHQSQSSQGVACTVAGDCGDQGLAESDIYIKIKELEIAKSDVESETTKSAADSEIHFVGSEESDVDVSEIDSENEDDGIHQSQDSMNKHFHSECQNDADLQEAAVLSRRKNSLSTNRESAKSSRGSTLSALRCQGAAPSREALAKEERSSQSGVKPLAHCLKRARLSDKRYSDQSTHNPGICATFSNSRKVKSRIFNEQPQQLKLTKSNYTSDYPDYVQVSEKHSSAKFSENTSDVEAADAHDFSISSFSFSKRKAVPGCDESVATSCLRVPFDLNSSTSNGFEWDNEKRHCHLLEENIRETTANMDANDPVSAVFSSESDEEEVNGEVGNIVQDFIDASTDSKDTIEYSEDENQAVPESVDSETVEKHFGNRASEQDTGIGFRHGILCERTGVILQYPRAENCDGTTKKQLQHGPTVCIESEEALAVVRCGISDEHETDTFQCENSGVYPRCRLRNDKKLLQFNTDFLCGAEEETTDALAVQEVGTDPQTMSQFMDSFIKENLTPGAQSVRNWSHRGKPDTSKHDKGRYSTELPKNLDMRHAQFVGSEKDGRKEVVDDMIRGGEATVSRKCIIPEEVDTIHLRGTGKRDAEQEEPGGGTADCATDFRDPVCTESLDADKEETLPSICYEKEDEPKSLELHPGIITESIAGGNWKQASGSNINRGKETSVSIITENDHAGMMPIVVDARSIKASDFMQGDGSSSVEIPVDLVVKEEPPSPTSDAYMYNIIPPAYHADITTNRERTEDNHFHGENGTESASVGCDNSDSHRTFPVRMGNPIPNCSMCNIKTGQVAKEDSNLESSSPSRYHVTPQYPSIIAEHTPIKDSSFLQSQVEGHQFSPPAKSPGGKRKKQRKTIFGTRKKKRISGLQEMRLDIAKHTGKSPSIRTAKIPAETVNEDRDVYVGSRGEQEDSSGDQDISVESSRASDDNFYDGQDVPEKKCGGNDYFEDNKNVESGKRKKRRKAIFGTTKKKRISDLQQMRVDIAKHTGKAPSIWTMKIPTKTVGDENKDDCVGSSNEQEEPSGDQDISIESSTDNDGNFYDGQDVSEESCRGKEYFEGGEDVASSKDNVMKDKSEDQSDQCVSPKQVEGASQPKQKLNVSQREGIFDMMTKKLFADMAKKDGGGKNVPITSTVSKEIAEKEENAYRNTSGKCKERDTGTGTCVATLTTGSAGYWIDSLKEILKEESAAAPQRETQEIDNVESGIGMTGQGFPSDKPCKDTCNVSAISCCSCVDHTYAKCRWDAQMHLYCCIHCAMSFRRRRDFDSHVFLHGGCNPGRSSTLDGCACTSERKRTVNEDPGRPLRYDREKVQRRMVKNTFLGLRDVLPVLSSSNVLRYADRLAILTEAEKLIHHLTAEQEKLQSEISQERRRRRELCRRVVTLVSCLLFDVGVSEEQITEVIDMQQTFAVFSCSANEENSKLELDDDDDDDFDYDDDIPLAYLQRKYSLQDLVALERLLPSS